MPIKDTQLTNKQHAVPQNIMDVEFKLIGDLTMRQFAYLLVFGGIGWICFVYVGGIFKWPFVLLFVALGIGLAFVPIEDRGMDQWVINFIKAVYTPNQKIWKKDLFIPNAFMYQNLNVVRQELITLTPTSSRRKLEEYLEAQNKNPVLDKLDILEQEYIRKVRDAFSKDSYVSELAVPIQKPFTALSIEEEPIYMPSVEPKSAPVPSVLVSPPEPLFVPESKPFVPKPLPEPVMVSLPSQPPVFMQSQKGSLPTRIASYESKESNELILSHSNTPRTRSIKLPARFGGDTLLSPMTPDRHSGRRFTSLLPTQGEILLPVRRERVLKTSEELNIEDDVQEKTNQLQKLIEQIKKDESYKSPSLTRSLPKPLPIQPIQVRVGNGSVPSQQRPIITVQSKEIPKQTIPVPEISSIKTQVPVNEVAISVVDLIKSENAKLAVEIQNLKAEIEDSKKTGQNAAQFEKQRLLTELEQKRSHAATDYEALQRKIRELQEKLEEKEKVSAIPTSSSSALGQKVVMLVNANKVQSIVDKPNTIGGVVKDSNGNALVGLVIIIKNAKHEPVRAIKTNVLGQFLLATPLAAGVYTVEVGKSDKFNFTFDIIPVEVNGKILPSLEFIGR